MTREKERKENWLHQIPIRNQVMVTGSLYFLRILTRTNNLPSVLVNIVLLFRVKLDDEGKWRLSFSNAVAFAMPEERKSQSFA